MSTLARALTAPEPATCRTCDGAGAIGRTTKSWCPGCRCTTCGQSCEYPPECRRCAADEDAGAKRASDR